MFRRFLIVVTALCVMSVPLMAIVSGRSLTSTLSELHDELLTAWGERKEAQQRFDAEYARQHQRMIDVITECNKLSILLYTQEQGMTFDLAYALKKVTAAYDDFSTDRGPYDRIVGGLDYEIDRYARLIEALRRLPPMMDESELGLLPDSLMYHNDSLERHISTTESVLEKEVMRIAVRDTAAAPVVLDEEGEAYRDSCIRFASGLLKMHARNREAVVVDSTHYQEAYLRMKEAYDYAEERYRELERYVFAEGQTPFTDILANPGYYWDKTVVDLREQYDVYELGPGPEGSEEGEDKSEKIKEKSEKGEEKSEKIKEGSEGDALPFDGLSKKGENVVMVLISALQLIFLAFFWILTYVVLWLVVWWREKRRRKREKRKDKREKRKVKGLTPYPGPEGSEERKDKSEKIEEGSEEIKDKSEKIKEGSEKIKVKREWFVSREKLPLFAVLVGTVVYFLLVGFVWKGDEYIQMGVRHVNTFLWLLIAISGSLLVRVETAQLRPGIQLYSPTLVIVMVIILCRITFVPDRLMNFMFPPILFLIVLRQLFYCIKVNGRASSIDSGLGWVSLAIYVITFVFAFMGYTFVALLILVWWYFQIAVLLTIVCCSDLLGKYKERRLDRHVAIMRKSITYVTGEDRESLLMGATWLYDLIRQVIIPTLVILSLPMCVHLSLDMFDFNDLYARFYHSPFVLLTDKDGFETLRISAESVVYLVILFYVMRYVNRAIHAIWRYLRYATFMRKHNRTTIRANEINLSLGNSIISATVWMGFAVVVIIVWQIPTGSMSLVAGGLSAGIGLALKDTINNFLYGIQLMGGRLRVGDWIECDGVRGKVSAINYQCVQVETIEGTEMSFLNSSLFGKNFNNLTRNNSYELTKIVVGVAYGSDIDRVRKVIVEAMQKVRTKDRYGREIVDQKKGVYVVVDNMSDNAVDIAVKQYVLVAERIGYVDSAKEVIYEALTAAGISIPFPQCDVHIHNS